jgi:branched-chain amino acid transport system substrate-binding protein
MKKRLVLGGLLVLLLVVALTTIGCGGATETTTTVAPTTTATGPATGEPIKVGYPCSLTGSGAAPADSEVKGVQLQVDWVNANGGINGRPIEMIVGDDQSDLSTMVAVMNKMIQQDKVFAVIGPFEQSSQEAARAISEKAQIPHVACGPATLEQLKGTKYTWSVMISADPTVQSAALISLIKASGYKNMLAVADVLPIDQETGDLVAAAGPTEGFTFTKMPDTYGLDVTDFQPLLNKIMEEYKRLKPDAIFLLSNPVSLPAVYKGLRDLGVTEPIIGGSATAHPAIFSQGPEAVEGLFVMDVSGVLNPEALPDSAPNKALLADFFKRYNDKYGAAPDMFSTMGADFVTVLAAALKVGGDDKEKVRQALVNMSNVMTLEGPMTFTPENTNQGDRTCAYEFQVKNAVFEYVRTVQ